MTHVLHRHTRPDYPVADRGEGSGHPRIVEAVRGQVGRLEFAHPGFFTSAPMEELADRSVAAAPDGLDRACFASGGAEAIEASIKLARQYLLEAGQPSRTRTIARRQSYRGNTLGALARAGTCGAASRSIPCSWR